MILATFRWGGIGCYGRPPSREHRNHQPTKQHASPPQPTTQTTNLTKPPGDPPKGLFLVPRKIRYSYFCLFSAYFWQFFWPSGRRWCQNNLISSNWLGNCILVHFDELNFFEKIEGGDESQVPRPPWYWATKPTRVSPPRQPRQPPTTLHVTPPQTNPETTNQTYASPYKGKPPHLQRSE